MDSEERAAGLWYACFAFLSAAAILIHQLHENQIAGGTRLDAILDIAALWLLLKPASAPRLLVLCAAQLAAFCSEMPFVWSHWLFLALVNVSILATAAQLALRRATVTSIELFAAVAPALRLSLVLLYAFAALAKLNPAYLDPQQSCAVMLYRQLSTYWPWVPQGSSALSFSVWTSLGIELALPFALLFPPTRVAAIFVGGAFHILLGIPERYDFSAAMLPFYCLFVPVGCWPALGRSPLASTPLRRLAPVLSSAAMLPLCAAIVIVVRYAGGGIEPKQWLFAGKVLWLILCAASAALLIFALLRRETGPRVALFRLQPTVAMIGPLLIILAGISPYLGLNTERAFTMFSNLRTEGDGWNHLFLPRGLRLFHFQDELYAIAGSSDPELRKRLQRRESLVRFELQRQMSEDPEASVSYVLDGQRRQLAHAGDDAELAAPLSPVLAKLFWFKPVPQQARCTH